MANSTSPGIKRQKLNHHHHHNHQPLIPGLPDHVAQLCLSRLHPSLLYSTCRSWRRLIYSPSFPPFLSLYAVVSPPPPLPPPPSPTSSQTHYSNSIQYYNFDPISSNWKILPPPPPDPPLRLLLRHPSFISRNLPIQSISVSNNLVLLAATSHGFSPALSHPLIFNPLLHSWTYGPSLTTPRRWCALGASSGAIYVASGIGSQFSTDVARSVEKWDLNKRKVNKNENPNVNLGWEWEKKAALKDSRFSREAIDAVGWRGKLCMVNVKGYAVKEGAIYNVEKDQWKEMPDGMISGWRGPVAAMDEEVMYVVDGVKGVLRKYNEEKDVWEEVMESERLKGAEQVAARGGRVCVICTGGGGISVVDVVASPPRLWVVDLPMGLEAVAVHILPRMPVLASASAN
ncbi:F-box/kelch-repeat protein [Quillaja saponaria]|uniref:F-box/kelch-repeat protein n=1 Tax=Quillaja saponaria TaxID=32244 RepID=A0AAD7L829_QUISA|nr:F-box/kelch-repeat protein [Quillaja saponaria]